MIIKTKEIKKTLQGLAKSQGSYARLVQEIEERKAWGAVHELCKREQVRNAVDLVMLIEG